MRGMEGRRGIGVDERYGGEKRKGRRAISQNLIFMDRF